jgi:acyl carrier protein
VAAGRGIDLDELMERLADGDVVALGEVELAGLRVDVEPVRYSVLPSGLNATEVGQKGFDTPTPPHIIRGYSSVGGFARSRPPNDPSRTLLGGAFVSVEDKVFEIVADKMGVKREELKPETSFTTDLAADSLDVVELVMEFEDQFDLNIPDEDAEKIDTIGDAIKYIEEHT